MRQTSSGVPEPHNFDQLIVGFHAVDDPVGAVDNFAQVRLAKLRHDSAHFRKLGQQFGSCDESVSHASGGICIVSRDINDNILKIGVGARGNDYFPAHWEIFALTVSMGIPSPRSSSSSPS